MSTCPSLTYGRLTLEVTPLSSSSGGANQSSEGGENEGEKVVAGDASLFLGDATMGMEEISSGERAERTSGTEPLALSKLKVNEKKLLRAWGSIQVSVKEDWRKEDWAEVFFFFVNCTFCFSFSCFLSFLFLIIFSQWLRKFGVELLRESPSPALRFMSPTCHCLSSSCSEPL